MEVIKLINLIVRFAIPRSGFTVIKVFDLKGREVADIVGSDLVAGTHEVEFHVRGLQSGIYFYRLQVGNHTISRKMMVLR